MSDAKPYNDERGLLRSAGRGPRHRDTLTIYRTFRHPRRMSGRHSRVESAEWVRQSTVAEFERLPNREPKQEGSE